MAFIHGMGSGSQYTETSLWTNPSPSADFAAQTVTLSEGMSNFKYLAIKYKASKTLTEADAIKCIFLVEDISKFNTSTANAPVPRIGGMNSAGSASYSRAFTKASDTSISFAGAYLTNASGNSATIAIPLEILGINELAQGTQADSMKDWIRNMVFNGGFSTVYTLNPYQSRATLNEGQVVVDTTNKVVYLYVDFTIATNLTASSDWKSLFTLSSQLPASYMYLNTNGSARVENVQLLCDVSANNDRFQFIRNYNSTSYIATGFFSSHTFNNGDRFICYAAWSYI